MSKPTSDTAFKIPPAKLTDDNEQLIAGWLARKPYGFIKGASEEAYRQAETLTFSVAHLERSDPEKQRVIKLALRWERVARLIERAAELAVRL